MRGELARLLEQHDHPDDVMSAAVAAMQDRFAVYEACPERELAEARSVGVPMHRADVVVRVARLRFVASAVVAAATGGGDVALARGPWVAEIMAMTDDEAGLRQHVVEAVARLVGAESVVELADALGVPPPRWLVDLRARVAEQARPDPWRVRGVGYMQALQSRIADPAQVHRLCRLCSCCMVLCLQAVTPGVDGVLAALRMQALRRLGDAPAAQLAAKGWGLCVLPITGDTAVLTVHAHALALHVAAACRGVPGCPLAVLCEGHAASGGLYLPAMPDAFASEQAAQIWHCSGCGFQYLIGDCTQPMERRPCPGPGCRLVIGGDNHAPAPGQVRGAPPRTGHCVGPVGTEVELAPVRTLNFATAVLLRALVDAAALAGAAASPATAMGMVRSPHAPNEGTVVEYFRQHVMADVRVLAGALNVAVADAYLLVHCAAARVDGTLHGDFATEAARDAFERAAAVALVAPVLAQRQSLLVGAQRADGVLEAEVRGLLSDTPPLWAPHVPATPAAVLRSCEAAMGGADRRTTAAVVFLRRLLAKQTLASLPWAPGALQVLRTVAGRLDRRMTHARMAQVSVGWLLGSDVLAQHEREAVTEGLRALEHCLSALVPAAERLTQESPLSALVPIAGSPSWRVQAALAELQNRVVGEAYALLSLMDTPGGARPVQGADALPLPPDALKVSLVDYRDAHALAVSGDESLLPFITAYRTSTNAGDSGGGGFDLVGLAVALAERFAAPLPVVEPRSAIVCRLVDIGEVRAGATRGERLPARARVAFARVGLARGGMSVVEGALPVFELVAGAPDTTEGPERPVERCAAELGMAPSEALASRLAALRRDPALADVLTTRHAFDVLLWLHVAVRAERLRDLPLLFPSLRELAYPLPAGTRGAVVTQAVQSWVAQRSDAALADVVARLTELLVLYSARTGAEVGPMASLREQVEWLVGEAGDERPEWLDDMPGVDDAELRERPGEAGGPERALVTMYTVAVWALVVAELLRR